jgi:hypothetical protein
LLAGELHRRGNLQWLDNDAGPLLLIAAELKPFWSGIEPPKDGRIVDAQFRWKPGSPASDYDRACDVDGYAGVIDVGPGVAIVLNDEPLPTTWQPFPEGGGLLARLYSSETRDYPDRLPTLPVDLAWDGVGEFATESPHLILFNAGEPGDEPPLFLWLPIQLSRGRYKVETAVWNHSLMKLQLVRLRPIS